MIKQIPIDVQQQKLSISYYLQNSYNEFKRKKCEYFIGFFACVVVVLTTAVASTIIDKAPIIFLQVAESNAGQIDIMLTPQNNIITPTLLPQIILLNSTIIQEILQQSYPDTVTSRYQTDVLVTAPNQFNDCEDIYKQNYEQNIYVLYDMKYTNCKKSKFNLLAIDTNREQLIQLGRNYPYQELLSHEIQIHSKLSQLFQVNIGDTIIIEINLDQLSQIIVESYNYKYADKILLPINNFKIRVPYTVQNIFKNLDGKVPDKQAENTIIIESKHFIEYTLKFVSPDILDKPQLPSFIQHMKLTKLSEYSNQIIINLPKPRVDYYLNSNFDIIQNTITKIGSDICEQLGIFSFKMSLPLLQEMYPLKMSALFLGITLNVIIVVLIVLCIFLIHSLLMVSIDTKTFEMGVIRVLGLNTFGIIQLIITQALTFIIPAIIIGLILSISIMGIASLYFKYQVGMSIQPYPTASGFKYSVLLGFIIPLLSSLYPIKVALNQTLEQQLSTNLHSNSISHTQIQTNQINWTRVSFGLICLGFGISVYYLLPKALVQYDLGLLLGIFICLLMGLLFGLVLLSLNLQKVLEYLIIGIVYFWQNNIYNNLIYKNLQAHRQKNKQTTMMYTLSLGILIFVSISYQMEMQNSSFQARKSQGVYMSITINGNNYFDQENIEYFINSNLSDYIQDYAWVTDDLSNYLQSKRLGSNVQITNIGQLYSLKPKIIGVSSNFLQVTFTEFLIIQNEQSDSNLDIIQQLYTLQGSQKCIIGGYYSKKFNLNIQQDKSYFLIKYQIEQNNKIYKIQPNSVINSAPLLTFSDLPTITEQNIIVSLPTYIYLSNLNQTGKGINSLPMKKLLIKFKDYNLQTSQIISIAFTLYAQTHNLDISVWNFLAFQDSLNKNSETVQIIFLIMDIIVIFLCFFSLITQMSANIINQHKEIAVLRAVGLTKSKIIQLYVNEAFILVFGSSLLGMLIGIVLGYTLTIQRILFTQLPIQFIFPKTEFIIVCCASIICAIGSSLLPANKILSHQISQIMRL